MPFASISRSAASGSGAARARSFRAAWKRLHEMPFEAEKIAHLRRLRDRRGEPDRFAREHRRLGPPLSPRERPREVERLVAACDDCEHAGKARRGAAVAPAVRGLQVEHAGSAVDQRAGTQGPPRGAERHEPHLSPAMVDRALFYGPAQRHDPRRP
jgi:hypothetical protein